jgi:hypothetical protein
MKAIREMTRHGTYAEVTHYAVQFILNYDVDIQEVEKDKCYVIRLYKIDTLNKNYDKIKNGLNYAYM